MGLMIDCTDIDAQYRTAYRELCDSLGVHMLTYTQALELTEHATREYVVLMNIRDRTRQTVEYVERKENDLAQRPVQGKCRVCHREIPRSGKRGKPRVVCEGECREIYYLLTPKEREGVAEWTADEFTTVTDVQERVLRRRETL